ncbi:MAG: hypothetical protein HY859_09600 [Caulobacterales bacterium]|nr:hypothetical protein [Caulobacterales bacterium]
MAQRAQKMPANFDPVADAARSAMDAAKGDLTTAAASMETAVRKDPKLRDALTEPLIAGACMEAVRRIMHERRRSIWSAPSEPIALGRGADKASQADRVAHLASGTLLMFPLPGGVKLSEATRDDVVRAAGFYDAQAKDMGVKARWLSLIAQSIPAGKTVGEVLTAKRLKELQAEAQRDAA